jgi:hypothetical protein
MPSGGRGSNTIQDLNARRNRRRCQIQDRNVSRSRHHHDQTVGHHPCSFDFHRYSYSRVSSRWELFFSSRYCMLSAVCLRHRSLRNHLTGQPRMPRRRTGGRIDSPQTRRLRQPLLRDPRPLSFHNRRHQRLSHSQRLLPWRSHHTLLLGQHRLLFLPRPQTRRRKSRRHRNRSSRKRVAGLSFAV